MKSHESAAAVTKLICEIYQNLNIPTKDKKSIIRSIEGIYNRWERLRKIKSLEKERKTQLIKNEEKLFTNDLKNLFNASHTNVFNVINDTKLIKFSTCQKEK